MDGLAEEKQRLRQAGVHLKSLAVVDRIENGKIVLREE